MTQMLSRYCEPINRTGAIRILQALGDNAFEVVRTHHSSLCTLSVTDTASQMLADQVQFVEQAGDLLTEPGSGSLMPHPPA